MLSSMAVYWRDLPWIDLIERADRWADETRKRWENANYKQWLALPSYELLRIWGSKPETLYDDPEELELAFERARAVKDTLQELYPEYYPDVAIQTLEQWNTLSWPWKYTSTKQSVTIHHTADATPYRLPDDSLAWLQEIYRQHTVSRDWWDIGYNFVIDPQWRIYEWRSGGAGVVGGHANLWNNITSLGVALLGNFENVQPTSAALHSLVSLTTALTYQYSIDPLDTISLFNRVSEEPYVQAHMHEQSVLGHKDVKSTACPWGYLYAKIPGITEQVSHRLARLGDQLGSEPLVDESFIRVERAVWSDDDEAWVIIPWSSPASKVSCESFDGWEWLAGCQRVTWWIRLSLRYAPWTSGWKTVGIETDRGWRMVDFPLVWKDDIIDDIIELKAWIAREFTTAKRKIADEITTDRARAYLEWNISVLLYEPTRLDEVSVSCEGWCEVSVNGLNISNAEIITLREEVDGLVVFLDLVRYDTDQVVIRDPQWEPVQIVNYDRYSDETPLNIYRGELMFEIQSWRDLDLWVRQGMTVVNTLPFVDYLRWMGESSELQQFEKTKTLAYLTKIYALFYRSWVNPHPSLPEWASYTAVDDPRIFQRYLWAWIEPTADNRLQAVEATFDSLITYDWYVPILPYFHCSGGFTRSWSEKFWWTDTPWLQSKKDLVACESGQFEWHGVGMSGDGAEYLAQAWATAEEILEWYYEGIEFFEFSSSSVED